MLHRCEVRPILVRAFVTALFGVDANKAANTRVLFHTDASIRQEQIGRIAYTSEYK